MFEAVDIFLSVSQIMHENLQADSLDLCPAYSLKRSLDQTSCLTTAFVKNFSRVRAVLCSFVLMKETWGEKKLRLVKEKQTRELKKRTAARLAELRAVSTGVATDIEEKGTQCNDWTPYLNACLFCFLLLVANLLFLQWQYTKRTFE